MSDVSVLGYNILYRDGAKHGFEAPATRFEYALKVIDEQNADLIGLQEACEDYWKEDNKINWYGLFKEALAARGYDCVGIKEQPEYALPKVRVATGLMIFYKRDRFTVEKSGCRVYPHDKARYYLFAEMVDKKFDKKFLFTNTHFSITQKIGDEPNLAATHAVRTVEALLLANFWLRHTENAALPLIGTGDYNSIPTTEAQGVLRASPFCPSYETAAERDEVGSVFDWYIYTDEDHVEKASIDYCYINPAAQAVTEYRVIRRIYPTDSTLKYAGHPSDHRPIMTYFNYK